MSSLLNIELDLVHDLDRGRITHVMCQRAKKESNSVLFLSLPDEGDVAINSVGRFLNSNSTINIFGDNDSTYKTVLANLGKNPNIKMFPKFLGTRDGRFAVPGDQLSHRQNFHPLFRSSKIQNFTDLRHKDISRLLGNIDTLIGNQTRFVTELAEILLQNNPAISCALLKVERFDEIKFLNRMLPDQWKKAYFSSGPASNPIFNFIAWRFELTHEQLISIVTYIHPRKKTATALT